MTPASPPRKICHILSESVRLRETFSLESVDHQVCTASFHEVLVASGIVGVCKVQVPEDSLLVDHFLPALSTALASILAEVECTTDCCYGHVVGEWYETLFEGSTFFGLRKHVRCG